MPTYFDAVYWSSLCIENYNEKLFLGIKPRYYRLKTKFRSRIPHRFF